MMQPYKGYFIEGSALLVHPFSRSGMLAVAFSCRAAPGSLARSIFLLHAKVQIFLLLRMVTESVAETVNGQ